MTIESFEPARNALQRASHDGGRFFPPARSRGVGAAQGGTGAADLRRVVPKIQWSGLPEALRRSFPLALLWCSPRLELAPVSRCSRASLAEPSCGVLRVRPDPTSQ